MLASLLLNRYFGLMEYSSPNIQRDGHHPSNPRKCHLLNWFPLIASNPWKSLHLDWMMSSNNRMQFDELNLYMSWWLVMSFFLCIHSLFLHYWTIIFKFLWRIFHASINPVWECRQRTSCCCGPCWSKGVWTTCKRSLLLSSGILSFLRLKSKLWHVKHKNCSWL